MRARALPMARALVERGHRVTILMPPWHTPAEAGRAWNDDTVPAGVPGVQLEYISLAGLQLPFLGHAIVALRMARRAMALRPDVVHAFKPKAYSGLAAGFLRAYGHLSSRQRFALVMDTDDWEGPGGWNDLEPYSGVERRFFAWQERWGLAHADAVTVASRALETLVWAMGVPPAQVLYLPNALGGDTASAAAAASAAPTAATGGAMTSATSSDHPIESTTTSDQAPIGPNLLLYTRFFEFNLDRPLLILAKVNERFPAARLIVAGKGLFGEEQAFLAAAEAAGLASAVDYRGWVEPAQAAALFAQADVALYPFEDTLINRTKSAVKLLELLDAGLPVVADAVGQNAEVIQDGVSGRLVWGRDTEAFAEAVCSLLADPAARERMGKAAHSRVRDSFNWSRQVLELEELYSRVAMR